MGGLGEGGCEGSNVGGDVMLKGVWMGINCVEACMEEVLKGKVMWIRQWLGE